MASQATLLELPLLLSFDTDSQEMVRLSLPPGNKFMLGLFNSFVLSFLKRYILAKYGSVIVSPVTYTPLKQLASKSRIGKVRDVSTVCSRRMLLTL